MNKYKWKRCPDHPHATSSGSIMLHKYVMEEYLGRYLEDGEISHHIDENKSNNEIENLELCLVNIHSKYHKKNSKRKYVKLKCPTCDKIFDIEYRNSHFKRNKNNSFCSRKCSGKFCHQKNKLLIIQEAIEIFYM